MFIAIESIDNVDKITQVLYLTQHLKEMGREVFVYSFPRVDSPVSRVIRKYDPKLDEVAQHCMQLADMYSANDDIVRHLCRGIDVVCCRWWPSAIVRGLSTSEDGGWVRKSCDGLHRADLYLLLDCEPVTSRSMYDDVNALRDRERVEQLELRRKYLDLWKFPNDYKSGSSTWTVVDASGSAIETRAQVAKVVDDSILHMSKLVDVAIESMKLTTCQHKGSQK